MTARVLRAGDRPAQAWKNKGGVTREVAAWPSGASLDDFVWRVSLAVVREEGPFSMFRGVDRTLLVLDGELHLAIEGRDPVRMSPATPPLSFAGELATEALQLERPVLDLNVMSRRFVKATLERLDIDAACEIALPAADHVVCLACGPMRIDERANCHRLEIHDALLLEAPQKSLRVTPRWPTQLCLASFAMN